MDSAEPTGTHFVSDCRARPAMSHTQQGDVMSKTKLERKRHCTHADGDECKRIALQAPVLCKKN